MELNELLKEINTEVEIALLNLEIALECGAASHVEIYEIRAELKQAHENFIARATFDKSPREIEDAQQEIEIALATATFDPRAFYGDCEYYPAHLTLPEITELDYIPF